MCSSKDCKDMNENRNPLLDRLLESNGLQQQWIATLEAEKIFLLQVIARMYPYAECAA